VNGARLTNVQSGTVPFAPHILTRKGFTDNGPPIRLNHLDKFSEESRPTWARRTTPRVRAEPWPVPCPYSRMPANPGNVIAAGDQNGVHFRSMGRLFVGALRRYVAVVIVKAPPLIGGTLRPPG
jgi:hypothetical protein